MSGAGFPTSKDIYLEVNGKKLAVVESYKAKAVRESRYVEAFGEQEPVGTVAGRVRHIIELGRIYATDAAIRDGVSFFNLTSFNLVIVKPDRRVIYSGCEWSDILESVTVGDVVAERVTVVAAKRMELI
ncbi:hypothetical protein [Acetanaerobacterium elongatum]|uniref:Phage tail tube protein n=1 Tax=Acetanaerobacterium elongatum TaxID=258515 RepID=A0A1H0ELG0_9FIRM|nr:hypothetical protein [Acetanaerobacterium elongatum]SDN83201.1 hypothetical protein SAMN05192585_13424 [Acetanaerobacterium elongatum]